MKTKKEKKVIIKISTVKVESLSFHYHHYLNIDKIYVIVNFTDHSIERYDYNDPEIRKVLHLDTECCTSPYPIRFYHTFYNFERPINF